MTLDRARMPALGADEAFRFPRVRRAVLPCGIGLRTVEHRGVPVIALLLVVTVGAADDPADRPGLAALTADLLDEGSGDRSAIDIHEAIARIGGVFDTETGYDTTVVSLVTLARFHDRALELLADIVFAPRFAEDDVVRVRALRLNRLKQLRDVPAALAEEAFARHLFGAHPYGHLPIGTLDALGLITTADPRAFHALQYRVDRATLVAVGDAGHDALAEAAERAFARVVPQARSGRSVTAAATPGSAGARTRRLVLVDRPGAPQSELRLGRVAASRSTPDYHALVTLNSVLGGQFVSRINLNLREEKGYTYGARSVFDFRRRPGPFVVQVGVQTAATAASIREVVQEVEDIRGARPATDGELELARAALTRGYARNFETAEQLARAVAQQVVHGLPDDYYDRFVGDILRVDAAAVTSVAERWLDTADLLTVVVGDRATIAPGLVDVGVGELV